MPPKDKKQNIKLEENKKESPSKQKQAEEEAQDSPRNKVEKGDSSGE